MLLFISPHYLMDDSNQIPSDQDFQADVDFVNAPPRYDEHYLDRLYENVPRENYDTPVPSGGTTPMLISRQNSVDNLLMMGILDPMRLPDASSGRWNEERSTGNTPNLTPTGSSASTPLVTHGSSAHLPALAAHGSSAHLPALAAYGSSSALAAMAGAYGSPPAHGSRTPIHGSSTPVPMFSGQGFWAHHDVSRTSSPPSPPLESLSRVPSYSTAVRTGTRNLDDTNALPVYHEGDMLPIRSAPVSPQSSPPTTSFMGRPRMLGRSGTTGSMSFGRLLHHDRSAPSEEGTGHSRHSSLSMGHRSLAGGLTAGQRSHSNHHLPSLSNMLGGLRGTQ